MEIFSHLIVGIIFGGVIWFLKGIQGWDLFAWWMGVLGGTFLLDFDHFLYWFVVNSEKEDSLRAKEIWRTKEKGFGGILNLFKSLYLLLEETHTGHKKLIFHSFLGQVILLFLGFFIVTSVRSYFGSGLILALNLHLLKDEWSDFLKDKQHLSEWLFWQINEFRLRKMVLEYLLGVSFVFLILVLVFVI